MPRKPRMVYVPLDVEFFDNAKVLAAGEKPTYLLLNMFCRVKRLGVDGVLTELQIERLQVQGWRSRLAVLIDVGLVTVRDDGGYLIVGWLERNLSAEQIANYRRKDSARKTNKGGTDSERNPSGIRADSGAEEEVEEEVEKEVEVVVGLRSVGPAVHSLGTTA